MNGNGIGGNCDFCRIALGDEEFLDGGKLMRRVVFGSDNFVVFASLGALVEGYFLIATKGHYENMASIPPGMYSELDSIISQTIGMQEKAFGGKTILFEHGTTGSAPNGNPQGNSKRQGRTVHACYDHAHLHAIANMDDIIREVEKKAGPMQEFESWEELEVEYAKSGEYFLYVSPAGKRFMTGGSVEKGCGREIPSQMGRMIVATKKGMPEEYDWAVFPHYEEMRITQKKARRYFLPGRGDY